MREELISYIWRHRFWHNQPLVTRNGEPVEVISIGMPNNGSGPDFFNAKIKVDNTLWAGNVEFHIKATDWFRHHHETDAAYNSVILHVVAEDDGEVRNLKGDVVTQVKLPISNELIALAEQLQTSDQPIACGHYWDERMKNSLHFMMHGLLCERLEQKVVAIEEVLRQNLNNWEETFYQVLAKSFGMKTNDLPFSMLAKSLPQIILGKHKDQLFQLEALLMGQAGLLCDLEFTDGYIDQLIAEYKYLSQKYSLSPLDKSLWKMGRLRPANSPYVRLSEFAVLTYNSEHLFRKVLDAKDVKTMHQLFNFGTSEYWETHYYPAQKTKKASKSIGESLRNSIFINCVAPMLFAYAKQMGNEGLQDRVIDLLESIPPEKNSVIEVWHKYGVEANNAFDSQALLEQKKNYCDKRECLRCKLGFQIFNRNNKAE